MRPGGEQGAIGVLVIEDDENFSRVIEAFIGRMGHDCVCTHTLVEGIEKAGAANISLVVLDVNLPDGSGLDVVARLRGAPGRPEVLVMTGAANRSGVDKALGHGAFDYLEKPVAFGELQDAITRALAFRAQRAAQRFDRQPAHAVLGKSAPLRACVELAERAAVAGMNVVIGGESGTGKSLLARTIHEWSDRSDAECVVMDSTCTGAAVHDHLGRARGGTLVIENADELGAEAQQALLAVLDAEPAGAESPLRVIATVRGDLESAVKRGAFRPDLLFRLRGVSFRLPPLRERPEDVGLLVTHHLAYACERRGVEAKTADRGTLAMLDAYDWPGNVRELIHAIDEAITRAGDGPVVFEPHLPQSVRRAVTKARVTTAATAPAAEESLREHRERRATEAEASYLRELLAATDGDIARACEWADVSRSRFYALLKKHDLQAG